MNIIWGIAGTLLISIIVDRMMGEFAKEVARSQQQEEAKVRTLPAGSADAVWQSRIRKVA